MNIRFCLWTDYEERYSLHQEVFLVLQGLHVSRTLDYQLAFAEICTGCQYEILHKEEAIDERRDNAVEKRKRYARYCTTPAPVDVWDHRSQVLDVKLSPHLGPGSTFCPAVSESNKGSKQNNAVLERQFCWKELLASFYDETWSYDKKNYSSKFD
jgi:hypothetical protein